MPVTLKDIAEQAATSLTTASRVLRGGNTFMIAKATRDRVLDVAAQLNYRPNRAAKLLVKGQTGTVAVAVSPMALTDWHWRQSMPLTLGIIQGVQEGLLDQGYDLKFLIPPDEKMDDCIRRSILDEQRVDGVILFGDTGFSQYIPEMLANGIKCVTFDENSKHPGIPIIMTDLRPGIRQMVQQAWELGHRSAGCLAGHPRVDAFVEECRAIGIQVRQEHCSAVDDEGDAWKATEDILRSPNCPTLLFCQSDHFAVASLKAIGCAGLKVPEDLSVVSIDNAPYVPTNVVPLATVRNPSRERGRLAATTLLQLINGADSLPDALTLKGSFIHRQSLGRCPTIKQTGE